MATAASSQPSDERTNKRIKGDEGGPMGPGGDGAYGGGPPQPPPGQPPMPHQQQQRYGAHPHYGAGAGGGPPHMQGGPYGWPPQHAAAAAAGYPPQAPPPHHHPHSWGAGPMQGGGGYGGQAGGRSMSPDRGNWNQAAAAYRGGARNKMPKPGKPQRPDEWGGPYAQPVGGGPPPPHAARGNHPAYWAHQAAGSPGMPPGMYYPGAAGKSPPRGHRGGRTDHMAMGGGYPPHHHGGHHRGDEHPHYMATRNIHDVDDGASSSAGGSGKDKGRGSYKCGRCGVPKKGHVCPYQPKVKRRPDEPPVETRTAAVQVELDEFMTLRRLNIRIQGFPESYVTEPYMGDNVAGEPHPVSLPPPVGGGSVLAPPPPPPEPDMMDVAGVPPPAPASMMGATEPPGPRMSPTAGGSSEIGVGDQPVEVAAASVPAEVADVQ